MIVNTFIITPKPEWRDAACFTHNDDAARMEMALPEKYKPLFRYLLSDNLNDLMDNRDHRKAYNIMASAVISGREGTWFSHTGECLQHIIRKTFYDTLLILHDDYNQFKYDYCIVVLSKEIISEKRWEELRHIKPPNGNGKVLTANFRNGT